jgi:sec-independent protein translocase protein TatA
MPDLLVLLIVILAVVLLVRGPKTIPKLGQALGRGVREARREMDKGDAEAPEAPETRDRP